MEIDTSDSPDTTEDDIGDVDVSEIVVGSVPSTPEVEVPLPLPTKKRVPRRKAYTRKKQRNTYVPKPMGAPESTAGPSHTLSVFTEHGYSGQLLSDQEDNMWDHQDEAPEVHDIQPAETIQPAQSAVSDEVSPSLESISLALEGINATLPDGWIVIADYHGFHILLMSSSSVKTVQREIFLKYNGEVDVIVHCKKLSTENEITNIWQESVVFQTDNFQNFIKKGIALCNQMSQFQVCTGANHEDTRDYWAYISDSYVDLNPYLEESYSSSCRSNDCHRLLPIRFNTTKCAPCSKIWRTLMQRKKFTSETDVHPNTANHYLNSIQAQQKLKNLSVDNRKKSKRISYLESKIEKVLQQDGIDLEEEDSKYFEDILDQNGITGLQRTFLEEQIKSSTVADRRAHRWHPAMIRLAIQIKSTSTAAYNILRDSGAVNLPHGRTLLDYTKAIAAQEGVNEGLLDLISEEVLKLPKEYQRFHSLIFDEMYVSQNLVYRKSDGALVGYAHLDEVDREVKKLEAFLQGQSELAPVPLATTVLAFMVKGLVSNVKCVIASYPCKELNKTMLYSRVWEDVIPQCEGAGIKILSVTCDGHPTNRAFLKLHQPVHSRSSGIVYDTLNFCSPDVRPLFFVSDVAHLLKTIRNCLHNSRDDGKGRELMINGEKLLWKHIVRLYYHFKGHTLRKTYKLSALNVFPTSYSTMRVKYAAQVLSQSVANDLKLQNWPGTKELINFIEKINKLFDILNGAHSSQATKTLNPNLAPYCTVDDERFGWLQDLWEDYFEAWRKQSEGLDLPAKEKARTLLSYQTLEGIETTIFSSICVIRFLLEAGAKFVMARALSQDPLELHFSGQRSSCGGNTNPNVNAFQGNQVSITLQRQLKQKHRNANVEDVSGPSEVDCTPVPKRARKKKEK